MEKKELIVKTKYEELYKTEYGYWVEHIEYEDEAETVRFEGGGCSISNEVMDKLLDKAREEGYQQGWKDGSKGRVFEKIEVETEVTFKDLRDVIEGKEDAGEFLSKLTTK